MHGNLPAQAQRAIFTDAQSCSDKTTSARLCGLQENQWFTRTVRALWKTKPGATLHFLTNTPERTCQAYAAGAREPSGDFIVRLLRSTEGARVLAHLMHGCTQQWWRDYQAGQICLAAKIKCDAEIQQLELGI